MYIINKIQKIKASIHSFILFVTLFDLCNFSLPFNFIIAKNGKIK